MKTWNSTDFCAYCPRNNEGLCECMIKIIAEESKFQSPNHVPLHSKQYLYHQGDQLCKTYILKEGWILLTHTSEQGKRQVIRSVLSGDLFGFQPDLHGPSLYSAIAVQDSIICNVPNIIDMCQHSPELALKLVWSEACEITLTELYMVNIAHRNAQEKVAFMALELYQRLKFRGLNNGYIIPFPLTQEDIADTLGLTTIHVNRTLHTLEQDKLISIHNHELAILDYKKLDSIVGMELKPIQKCCNMGSLPKELSV